MVTRFPGANLPRTPANTYAIEVHPRDVRVGDSVRLDGSYHAIRDMRAAGPGGEKILIFNAHTPWRMVRALLVFRPLGAPPEGGRP